MSEQESQGENVAKDVALGVRGHLVQATFRFRDGDIDNGMIALNKARRVEGLPTAWKTRIDHGRQSFQKAIELEAQGLWDDAKAAAQETEGERIYLDLTGPTAGIGYTHGGLELWHDLVTEFLSGQRSRRVKTER